MFRIVHLIDDTQPGGVMRYLDFLANDPVLAREARHEVVTVSRTRPLPGAVAADLIVSHLTVTWRGLPGLMLLRATHPGVPLIHVEHSYCAGFAAANVSAPRRFHTLLRSAYALFDRVVAVSAAQGAWLRLRGLVQPGALSVIQPCVALDAFRAVPAPHGPALVIGAVGRFDRQKGFDLLIEAFRGLRHEAVELHLFGDGPERARLEYLARGDLGIRFRGFAADPAAAIAACDVIAMPSRWEPYGLVAIEALAAGRRLLVSGADGLTDHVVHGAEVVREGSVRGWTAALAGVVGQEPRPLEPLQAEAATRVGWSRLLRSVGERVAEAA